MTATFDNRTRRVSVVSQVNPNKDGTEDNLDTINANPEMETPTNGCYCKGDSIEWWLNQFSNDRQTQEKKTNILNKLTSEDCDRQVRIDIGDHADTPIEVLLLLSQDEDSDVRYSMAENHNMDERVLKLLMDDSNPYVAYRAEKTLVRIKGIFYRAGDLR